MSDSISIGGRRIGAGAPAYIIAEIGINHNGDLALAKKLIDTAALAGCDAVKFQKRTPELCVPPEQQKLLRETPWGLITYLDYRYRVEFGEKEYGEINRYCREKGIAWFVSCWDEPSVKFMEQYDPVCYKIASASITDEGSRIVTDNFYIPFAGFYPENWFVERLPLRRSLPRMLARHRARIARAQSR